MRKHACMCGFQDSWRWFLAGGCACTSSRTGIQICSGGAVSIAWGRNCPSHVASISGGGLGQHVVEFRRVVRFKRSRKLCRRRRAGSQLTDSPPALRPSCCSCGVHCGRGVQKARGRTRLSSHLASISAPNMSRRCSPPCGKLKVRRLLAALGNLQHGASRRR